MTSPLRPVDSHPDTPSDLAEFIRPLPHSIEAEQHVLGAVMLSPLALPEVRALLAGSEFYRPGHRLIWDGVIGLADRGAPFEPVAVATAINGRDLAKIGGAPYLQTLISQVPSATNAAYYAQIVRNLAYARRVIEIGTRLMQLGYGTTSGTESDFRGAVASEVTALAAVDAQGWPTPGPLPQLPSCRSSRSGPSLTGSASTPHASPRSPRLRPISPAHSPSPFSASLPEARSGSKAPPGPNRRPCSRSSSCHPAPASPRSTST